MRCLLTQYEHKDSNKKKKKLPLPQLGVASPQEQEGSQDQRHQQNNSERSCNQQPCAESTVVLRSLRDSTLGRDDSRARSYKRRVASP